MQKLSSIHAHHMTIIERKSRLRKAVSDKVLQLRELNECGIGGTKPVCQEMLRSDLRAMFELGGVVSGGAALAYALGHKTKDFDIYFNNDSAFIKAYLLTKRNPFIDICWYFEEPHELHDIAVAMVNVRSGGILEITEQAQRALDTKVSDIYVENIIWPARTAKRLFKYHRKLGIRYPAAQLLSLTAMHSVDIETGRELLDTCAA